MVVGSRGLGAVSRFLQGSVSEHVATHADATVVTQHLGAQAAALMRTHITELDGQQIGIISVGRSPEPVHFHESKDKEELFVAWRARRGRWAA